MKSDTKALAAAIAGGGIAFFAFLVVVSSLMFGLGPRDDDMIYIEASAEERT